MYTFKIVIPFWCDKEDHTVSTRYENIIFVEHHLKKLCQFLTDKGVSISYQIYDFSVTPVVPGAIHHSFPLHEFRKAEKWNLCIAQTHEDFFIGMDADMIVHEKQYDMLYQVLQDVKLNEYYNFNCIAFDNSQRRHVDYTGYTTDNFHEIPQYFYVSQGHVLSMGGFFICPTKVLKDIGGYNETLVLRGGEDGEIIDRLNQKMWAQEYEWIERVKNFDLTPYHLPHFYDFENPKYNVQ